MKMFDVSISLEHGSCCSDKTGWIAVSLIGLLAVRVEFSNCSNPYGFTWERVWLWCCWGFSFSGSLSFCQLYPRILLQFVERSIDIQSFPWAAVSVSLTMDNKGIWTQAPQAPNDPQTNSHLSKSFFRFVLLRSILSSWWLASSNAILQYHSSYSPWGHSLCNWKSNPTNRWMQCLLTSYSVWSLRWVWPE